MKYTARPWQSTASLARGMSIFSPRTTATPQQANPVTDSIACARGGAIDLQRLAPGKGAHALSLARLGFTVHPLENRSKKPHLKDYKRLATADEPTIIGWWERWPDANPGIVVPQGRIRIDIDRRRGGDRSLAILEATHTELPMSWQTQTADGIHIDLVVPDGIILKHGELAPGVEVLGEGSNVMGVGSVHPSGHVYTWMPCYDPGSVALAQAPQWFLTLAAEKGLLQQARIPANPHTGARTVLGEKFMENSLTPGVFLLATPATSILEETPVEGKLDGAKVKALFSDWRVVQQCLQVIGLGHVRKPGQKFRCVFHKDHHPSASIFQASDGEYRYADYHHSPDEPSTVSLTSVYIHKRTGAPLHTRLKAPSYLTWSLRLLADAGVLQPKTLAAPKANGLLSDGERSCYEGFKELLSLKGLYDDKAPSPFTWAFAATWLGETTRRVEQFIKGLLSKGVLRVAGYDKKGTALFVLGSRSLIKRRLRRRHDLKQRQEAIATDLQHDVDAILSENATPRSPGLCQHSVDAWVSCGDCTLEAAQRRLEERQRHAGIISCRHVAPSAGAG
jgi:hypothetical protein